MSENDKPELEQPPVYRSPAKDFIEARERANQLVKRLDQAMAWDDMQAKDLPADLLDYVHEKLREGWEYNQIRRQLGITKSTDKSWKKILAALKQGFRVDGTAFLVQTAHDYQVMGKKLRDQILHAFDHGVEVATKEGTTIIKGPSKELSTTIDAYNRLQQGFVKLGKDMGAFMDGESSKGPGSGVTIVVQNAIPLPSQKDIDQKHQKPDIILDMNDKQKS